jgi:hypothetical protein
MRIVNNRSQLENRLADITEEQRQNSYTVLKDFFSCFDLQDLHQVLWNWLVVAMSSESGVYSTGVARSNLFYVYEKLGLLIEAAYEIDKRSSEKAKIK